MKKWKVKELREHLVQYDIHRNSAIKNKTELLQELLKKEIEAEIKGRLEILRLARSKSRAFKEMLKDEDSNHLLSSKDDISDESEDTLKAKAEDEKLSLLSFSELVVFINEIKKVVHDVQKRILSGELEVEKNIEMLSIPKAPIPTAHIIEALAICFAKLYKKRRNTIYSNLMLDSDNCYSKDECFAHKRALVDLDPDMGCTRIFIVKYIEGRPGKVVIEEDRKVIEAALGRFSLEDKDMQYLLKDAIKCQLRAVKKEWKSRVGEVVDGTIIEEYGFAGAVLQISQERDKTTVLAMLDEKDTTPGEIFSIGDTITVLVKGVTGAEKTAGMNYPLIYVSRNDASLVAGVLTKNVPAISEGQAQIFGISRVAGLASKVGIELKDNDRGGTQTLRFEIVQQILEIGKGYFQGEDICPVFKADFKTMVAEALSYKHRKELKVSEPQRGTGECSGSVIVHCPKNLQSSIVGIDGCNAQLVSKLLGFRVHVAMQLKDDFLNPSMNADDEVDDLIRTINEVSLREDDATNNSSDVMSSPLHNKSTVDPELRDFVTDALDNSNLLYRDMKFDDSSDYLDLAKEENVEADNAFRLHKDGDRNSLSALLEEVLGHEAPDKSEEKKLDSGLSSMDDLEQLPRSWQRDPMDEFFMDVLDVSDEEIEKRMQSEIMPKAMNEYVRFEENNDTAGNIDNSFEELIDSISTSESFHDTRWSDESKSSKFRTSRKTQSYHGESTPPPLFPTPLKLAASQSIDKWDQSKDKVFRRGPDSEIDEDKKRDRLRLGTINFPHRAAVYNFFSTLLWETNFGYILNNVS